MEADKNKVKEKDVLDNNNKKNNEQQPKKGWMDLLKNYVKDGVKTTKYQQEEKTTKLFLEILDSDKNKKKNSNPSIPRFFFKNPTNF